MVLYRGVTRVLLLALLASGPAIAQMPFLTDDPGVADRGMLHVEVSNELDSLQSMQYPDLRQNTANFKVNFGLPFGLELDIDAPYITIDRASTARDSHGMGDTNLGVKWNLRDVSPDSHKPGFLCLGVTAGTYRASPRFGAVIGIAVDLPHFFHPAGLKLSRIVGLPARDSF